MEFGSGQAKSVLRTNSEEVINNNSYRSANHGSLSSIDHDLMARRAELIMEMQELSASSISTMGDLRGRSNKKKKKNLQQEQRRSTDPFDMYAQLKKQKQKQQQHIGDNGDHSNGSFSPMSSFHRINTFGSLASMGSLSKLSTGDMSLVLSSQGPANGKNNQSWGNLNNMNMNSMNEKMHSSLPIMNASFGHNNHTMGNIGMGMNMGMNRNVNTNNILGYGNRPNNYPGREVPSGFMAPMISDDAGSSYRDTGNSFPNNGRNHNIHRVEGVISGGFGGGMNSSLENGGSGFNNNCSPMTPPKDFSKLSNEQLRQMILIDAIENSGGPRVVSQQALGAGSVPIATNKSNTNYNGNSNPFLKNLGLMDYRNHVMPLTIQKGRKISVSGNANEDSQMVSDHASSTGHSSTTNDFNTSSSNFSFHSDSQTQDDHATMPDEQESYNAAANGILAPWSAHAAGLFGDMMVKSNQDEKAKKASRKKPKDKPKRPLSAYNIFFKEERNRIMNEIQRDGTDADATVDGVPTTIAISDDFKNNTDQEASVNVMPFESKSCDAPVEDAKLESASDKKGNPSQRSSYGRIGFESLAKMIGRRWQELDETSMLVYKSKAGVDMVRYKKEMDVWDAKNGTTSSRKRGTRTNQASNNNKKSKHLSSSTNDLTSTSAHESTNSGAYSQLSLSSKEGRMPRRNSTGGALGRSSSRPMSSKHPPSQPRSYRDLNQAGLGSELFQVTEGEEGTNNRIILE